MTDSRGNKQLSYFYSNAGLLLTMQDSDGNSVFASLRISNHKFQIANDSLHNRVRQFEIWNSESVIARCASADYDPTGRLTGIWAPNNDYTAFAYDDAGRLIEKWFPNGVNTQYSYNRDNTLQKIINRHGAGITISQHDYLYDGVGNRITHSELINGTTTPNKYVYDNLNRLTEVRNNDTNALIESYSFGAVGNRIASQSSAFGGATVYYNHDAANQLIDIRTGSSSGPLVAGFVYDENGNLTKKCESGTVTVSSSNCTGSTVTDLTHDSFNRLTQVAKTSISTESYKYDDQGNRIQKTVGSTITNFLYNGPDVVGQYTSSWGTASAILTHGPGMDDPIVRTTSTTTQYFHQDGLGSVVSVTNQSGTTDGTARYDAWGNKIASTGTIPQYGYTGREPADTGLVYYRARFYDPSIGRFTQRDPIGFEGGLNLYAYVGNSPINLNDPSGENPWGWFYGAISGGVGGTITGYANSNTLKGAAIGMFVGAVAGAAVGTIAPWLSNRAGAALGGAASNMLASAAGQLIGSGVIQYRDPKQQGPIDFAKGFSAGAMFGAGVGGAIAPPVGNAVRAGFAASGGLFSKLAEVGKNIYEGAIVGVSETLGALLDKGYPDPIGDASGAEVSSKPGSQSIQSFGGLLPLPSSTSNDFRISPNADIYCISMCISDYTSSSTILQGKQKK